jgi:hypothetical protein
MAAGAPGGEVGKGPPAVAEELKRMEWEPLLPVEKKLIGWSIGLGVALLGILVWLSHAYFLVGR